MSDVSTTERGVPTLFVFTPDLLRQAKQVETWVKRDNRKVRRANFGWRVTAILLFLMCIILGGALNYAVPLIRFIPVFFYQRADGGTEFALTTDSMPVELADASVQSALWQYTMYREGYSWEMADYAHHVVMGLSDEKTGDLYDKWATGANPDSYLRVYGKDTVIRVGLVEITDYQRATAAAPGLITIHYNRIVYTRGEPTQKALWTVTMHFVQPYRGPALKIKDIIEFNPMRLVVVGYGPPLDISKEPAR